MRPNLCILITWTTYGSWLRGDNRGWVDDGVIMPPDPMLEAADRRRLKHPPYVFERGRLLDVGRMIGESLVSRLATPIFALHVGTWHVHLVVGAQPDDVAGVVKCAKDGVRFKLRPSRPIWTADYDKRFCFHLPTARNRIRYVERHNEQMGWTAHPWPFITELDAYLAALSPRHLAPGH